VGGSGVQRALRHRRLAPRSQSSGAGGVKWPMGADAPFGAARKRQAHAPRRRVQKSSARDEGGHIRGRCKGHKNHGSRPRASRNATSAAPVSLLSIGRGSVGLEEGPVEVGLAPPARVPPGGDDFDAPSASRPLLAGRRLVEGSEFSAGRSGLRGSSKGDVGECYRAHGGQRGRWPGRRRGALRRWQRRVARNAIAVTTGAAAARAPSTRPSRASGRATTNSSATTRRRSLPCPGLL
jgi:hypothetical protein